MDCAKALPSRGHRARDGHGKGSDMRHTAVRWLFALGALVAAGGLVFGRGGAAGASLSRAAVRGSAPAYVLPGRVLALGMHGPAVRRLQGRLAALKYYPGAIDGQFGLDTLEAVWAFKETQGLIINSANQDQVSRAAERALVHPRAAKVLAPHGGATRIVVNMGDEVLGLSKNRKPDLI